jgi:hypothetical protein
MTRFETPAQFDDRYPYAPATPRAPTIRTIALLAVLVTYAAGFAILYPIAASSVAKSVTEGNDPALLQFAGP